MGAVVGDFLDKPVAQGGLALDRYQASAILLVLIVSGLFFFRSKADMATGSHVRTSLV